MMAEKPKEAGKQWTALFDFDGVVVDTETQYSRFWHKIGQDYLDMDDLELRVKGQTLVYIYEHFFQGRADDTRAITAALDRFELDMDYDYVPGVVDFVADLHSHGVMTAVVTSSNARKMEAVYVARPEIRTMFRHILTSEDFSRSKPDPECFLLGMKICGTAPCDSFVFEDSFNGLRAGMASGATVVGLATTNSREAIAPYCNKVLDDFRGFTFGHMLEVCRK